MSKLFVCSFSTCAWLAVIACNGGEPGFVATDTATINDGRFEVVGELTLDRARVELGETQAGQVKYKNSTAGTLHIERIVIAMRRPGATHAGGPYDDAAPQAGPLDVAPDDTVRVTASRPFQEGDALGTWEAYPTYQDDHGEWHDGPGLSFEVAATHSAGCSDAGTNDPDPTVPPDGGVTPSPETTPGYLHTRGAQIVDSNGAVVRLTGINWFGLETPNYAPHGLWQPRSLGSYLDQIASLGYNVVRVPFSSQLFDAGSTPNGIDFTANPDLRDKSGVEILDALIQQAGTRGLRIILDRHRPDAGSQSELWYTAQYPESRWIADWQMLASRYRGDPTVIGADLHNEPHGSATWGDGNLATDWRLAAERGGNAILAVNPDWLIFVEGVETVGTTHYWWGGNLSGAGANPVRLDVPDRVVYSPHDYPASVYQQTWFNDPAYPSNLPSVWDQYWGYLAAEGTAPVWLGEFGTRNQTETDRLWLTSLAGYLGTRSLSFAYWCLNPNSGDTGGILQDDWITVNTDKQAVLDPILAPRL